MAERDKAAQAALGISAGAAVVAALAFLQKRAVAAPGEAAEIPEELWNLIIAIAETSANVDQGIQDVVRELSQLAINVQGFPANTETMTAFRVACQVANQPYQLPALAVTEGMALHLLAFPFNPPAPGLILVSSSSPGCLNINQAYPMPPGATKDYFVKNADALWISANAVPAWLVVTVEQRRS